MALAKDCKSNKLFKVTQAVSSRLVEEQLQELQPLFAQDKVMIGKLEVLQKIDKIFKSSTSRATGIRDGIISSVRLPLEYVLIQDKKHKDSKI